MTFENGVIQSQSPEVVLDPRKRVMVRLSSGKHVVGCVNRLDALAPTAALIPVDIYVDTLPALGEDVVAEFSRCVLS